ncbi:MAG: SprB repeat-containing protein, partial [Flavobacteriales bacterium]
MKGPLKINILIFIFTFVSVFHAQIVQPFAIRYQTNQKGGITFVANTALTCNPNTNGCTAAAGYTTASISSNTYNNNNWTMQYVNVDNDPSTFMSSSDSLNLPQCSEITWAGLYWCASNTNGSNTTPTGWANRNQCKFKVNNGAYQTLTADQIVNSSTGYLSYFCYKNVTSIVQAAGTKARFTLADMICWTGGQNFAGGWNLVVVYKNTNMTDRNLTVFDGLAVVSSGNSTTVPINGFVTPLSGPVNFELGVVTLDGDRGSTGDQLSFNGVANNYVNVTDAMHAASNSFNSTICYNGAFTPFRLPNYNNTLGYDANIYVPNNAAKNYIGNAATSANIRLATNTDIVMAQVITSAIDIYQPDLRATLSINDLNGGQVMANDILEYTIKCVNIGSDTSINTFVVDTLDIRTNLIPGTLQVLYGPNTGFKTDALADDQGEYNAANRTVKFRIGTGANGINGGQVNNSVQGNDSTLVRFRVQVIDDCLLLNCDSTLTNLAYIYGTGNISGALYTNNGTPNTYDAFGCPTNTNSSVVFHTSGCPLPDITNNGPICAEDTLVFDAPNSPFAIYSWTGPNTFTSTLEDPSILNSTSAASGTYNLLISFTGNACTYNLTEQAIVWPIPTITSNITNVSCYNYSDGQITLTSGINTPYSYSWNTGSTNNPLTNLVDGTYTVIYTDINGCVDTSTFSVTEPPIFVVNATITSNYNGEDVSCFGSTNGSVSSTVTGGTAPYTYQWSNSSTNANLSNIGAGTYILVVTDANGCQASDTVTLVNPPQLTSSALITSNYNGQNVSCFGSTNGSASVSAS